MTGGGTKRETSVPTGLGSHGFDNRPGIANLGCVMPFDATLNRGLLRAGNLIAGK